MALELYQGFRPYLLKSAQEAFLSANPQYKIEEVGFVSLLKSQNPRVEVLRINEGNGHKKFVQVKAKKRFNVAHTETSKSCDVAVQQSYYEKSVELSSTRQIAIYIEDEKMAKYTDDATNKVAFGDSTIAQELYDDVKTAASAIVEAINQDLFTIAVSSLGINKVTGSAAAATVNFPLDTTNNALGSGMTKILTDFKVNNFSGKPQIVGSGLLHSYMLQQKAKIGDQSGLDTRIQAASSDFFYDPYAATALGANQAIVYEPDAVGLVEYNEYTGYKAGSKPGASEFGTVPLPLGTSGQTMTFDWQLKYFDCPTSFTDGYYGTTINVGKGWYLILSKQAGLWTIPSDAYRNGTDAYYGNRGSLRYSFTNV